MKSKRSRLPKRMRNGARRVTNNQGVRVWLMEGKEYPTLRAVAIALSKQTQDVHPFAFG